MNNGTGQVFRFRTSFVTVLVSFQLNCMNEVQSTADYEDASTWQPRRFCTMGLWLMLFRNRRSLFKREALEGPRAVITMHIQGLLSCWPTHQCLLQFCHGCIMKVPPGTKAIYIRVSLIRISKKACSWDMKQNAGHSMQNIPCELQTGRAGKLLQ